MTRKVKVLVTLIDNGILHLPGDVVELDETIVERGIAHQLYELIEPSLAQEGENNG